MSTTPILQFGAPAATSAPTLQFGAPTATTPLQFGAPAATTPLQFGAPAATTPLQFGAPAATTPLQFGAPAATTAPTLQFGAPAATVAPTFGAPTATVAPTLQFGAPAATTASTIQFGAPAATTAPTIQFGAPSGITTPAVAPTLFGTPTTTTAAAAPTVGPNLFGIGTPTLTTTQTPTTGIPSSTPGTGLTLTGGLGQPTTLTSSGVGTLPTFGIQTNTGLGGLGGQIQPQQFQTPIAGTTGFAGLGGTPSQATTDNTFTLTSTTTNGIKPEHRTAKDQPLPPELLILVEEFKNHVKSERVKLTEISAVSEKAADRVSEYCDEIRQSVANVSNVQHRQMLNLDAIRQLINQDIRDAETAQLIRDTPISLQQNYQFPIQYLFRMIKDFEDKMVVYQREIAKSEAALHAGAAAPLNARELCLALKASRDVLVVLAAKVKTLHDKVAHEIETHQNLLQFVHGDTAKDIFSDHHRTPAQAYMSSRHRGLPFPDQYPTTDPAKTYMSYLAASKVLPSVSYPQQLRPNEPYKSSPFNVTGSGGQSTFYHSHQMSPTHSAGPSVPSQSISPGISLKRTKH